MTLFNHMVEYQDQSDSTFRALADPTRRQMVERLSQKPCTVGELAEPLSMSFAGASKHVGVLEAAGIVRREKRGRERLCILQPKALFEMRDWVERYSRFWNARLDALDQALKEDSDE